MNFDYLNLLSLYLGQEKAVKQNFLYFQQLILLWKV